MRRKVSLMENEESRYRYSDVSITGSTRQVIISYVKELYGVQRRMTENTNYTRP